MEEEGAVGNFSSKKWAVGEKRLGAHDLNKDISSYKICFVTVYLSQSEQKKFFLACSF